jgi:hypothetical protein
MEGYPQVVLRGYFKGILPSAYPSNVPLQVFSGETTPTLRIRSPTVTEVLHLGVFYNAKIYFERTGKIKKLYVKGRGLDPALKVGEQFILKFLIRPVISFNPNPSIRIVSRGLAIFVMSCHPTSPTIIMARDPHSFPGAWNPFTNRFPVARNIFPWRRIIIGY